MSEPSVPPPAAGVRIAWEDVPAVLRAKVEAMLGGEVVEAVTQVGGFSPGAAARLRLAGGARAFVKAVSVTLNPDTPALHRTEARVTAALPTTAPAPRLLGSLDEDGWVVLVFEDVEGMMPELPWRPEVLERVVDTLARMAAALDPAPVAVPAAAERFAPMFVQWRELAAARDANRRQQTAEPGGPDPLFWLDPWARRHLDRLAALESVGTQAASGTALLHMDVRADNLLLTADGDVVVVDWPWAVVGAPWLDLLLLAASVWMHGGEDAARIVTEHPLLADADRADVAAVLAGFSGRMLVKSREPGPPGLPTLRPWQVAMAGAMLDLLKTYVDWQ